MFIRVLWWVSVGLSILALMDLERLFASRMELSHGDGSLLLQLIWGFVVVSLLLALSLATTPTMRAHPRERLLGLFFIPLGAADFAFLFHFFPALA